MKVNEFLQKYRRVEFGLNVTRPRVRCADGFTVSVQAGYGLRSLPGDDAVFYTHVELGYPSEVEEDLLLYEEDEEHPDDTVYNYVPVTLVDEVFEAHGGIAGADFSNDRTGKWRGWQ